jgi:hypothetical protein
MAGRTKETATELNQLFVVTCKYEGCDECSSGSHVVGVFTDETVAEQVSREHEQMKNVHFHYHWSNVDRVVLNKTYHKENY